MVQFTRLAFVAVVTLHSCARSRAPAAGAAPTQSCYRLAAVAAELPFFLPRAIRLTTIRTTSHFSDRKGFEAEPLPPDTIARLASLLWSTASDSLLVVYDHYFVHIEVRLARLGDSLSGTAIYSSDVRGGSAPAVGRLTGHRIPC